MPWEGWAVVGLFCFPEGTGVDHRTVEEYINIQVCGIVKSGPFPPIMETYTVELSPRTCTTLQDL